MHVLAAELGIPTNLGSTLSKLLRKYFQRIVFIEHLISKPKLSSWCAG